MSKLDQLRDIFAGVLQMEPDEITDEMSQDDVDTWDSMATVTLVAEIEDVFGITFDLAEVISMDTFGLVVRALRDKGLDI